MNILFLEGDMSRKGGTEKMTALLSSKLSGNNNIWIISKHLNDTSVFYELNQKVNHSVLKNKRKMFGIFRAIKEIKHFIKENRIDWIINVDIGMCIYGIPAGWRTKARVITWEHANFYNNWNSKIFPYIRRFAAKCSDVLVVLTEQDKKNYQTHIKAKTPIYVIPNPSKKHHFEYNSDSNIIISAGLLVPIKGFDQAIQIASRVLPSHPAWKWMIYGEGEERENLEKLVNELGINKQVVLPGNTNNMAAKYQEAAMYAMTSEMEGLPMVLLEAKSWGLPIVSFDVMTGPSDIIRDKINGYLIEQGNVEAFAEKVENLIESKNLREEFSRNSQLDMERFSIEVILKKWNVIFTKERKMEGK